MTTATNEVSLGTLAFGRWTPEQLSTLVRTAAYLQQQNYNVLPILPQMLMWITGKRRSDFAVRAAMRLSFATDNDPGLATLSEALSIWAMELGPQIYPGPDDIT